MFQRLKLFSLMILLFSTSLSPDAFAQQKNDGKNPTAEQIAETVILVYGSRQGLEQIRRNGVERGRITRTSSGGRVEESTYERRFIRGENSAKDKIRIDQKMPSLEYSLVYSNGNTWGILNGATFTPRQEAAREFWIQQWHSIDALLRYKENGSTVTLIGKEKQKNLDLYVIDLKDKDNHKTRYYISAKFFRVLWLEYEAGPTENSTPVKFMRKFFDYRVAQGTLVPFRTVLLEGEKQMEETRVLTITYGGRIEEALFQNPDTQTTSSRP